jgi:uncharacterized membrane protein YgaE (UPF0421/DUF939 family)
MLSKIKGYLLAIGGMIAFVGYFVMKHKVNKAERARDEIENEYDEYKMSQTLRQEEQKRLVAEVEKESAISSAKKQSEIYSEVSEYKKKMEDELLEKENEKPFTFRS